MSIVVLVGNPRPESRTHTVALAVAESVAKSAGGESIEIVDLSGLAPLLLQPTPSPVVEEAVERVLGASVLVVASPTYKATYTGLLKVFLDRIGGGALRGTVALPVLVMGAPQHTLAVEVHLRPLLVELGATVPSPGLAFLESQFDQLEVVIEEWTQKIVPAVLGARSAGVAR